MENDPFSPPQEYNPGHQPPIEAVQIDPLREITLAEQHIGTDQRTIDEEARDDSALRDRGELNVGKIVDDAKVAYHGLRYTLSRIRQLRAEDRVAKMDRKDSVYRGLASESNARATFTGPAVTGSVEKPRTFIEKGVDRKITRKELKRKAREANESIMRKGMQAKSYGKGVTKTERLKETIGIAMSSTKTAHEKHVAQLELKTKRTTSPNYALRGISKDAKKAIKRHQRSTRQPVSARWRAFRRANARDTISSAQRRMDKHLQRAQDIENSRP